MKNLMSLIWRKRTVEGQPSGIQTIQVADRGGLESLLIDPLELESQEYKCWLNLSDRQLPHRALVAKNLIALTNHGGGHLVLGWSEDATGNLLPDPNRPDEAQWQQFSPDNINGIVNMYAEPPFQCAIRRILNPSDGEIYLIISTPVNFSTPVRSKKNGPMVDGVVRGIETRQFYVRRPQPETAVASGAELDALIDRCIRIREQNR